MQTQYLFCPLNLPIAERNLEVKRNGILLLTRNWLVFAWDKIPLHCILSGGLNFPLQQPLYKFSWGTKDLQNCFTIFHLLGHPSNYPVDCKEVLHSGISSLPNSILQFIHAHKQQQNLLASIHYGVQDNDKMLQKDSKKSIDFTLEDLGKTIPDIGFGLAALHIVCHFLHAKKSSNKHFSHSGIGPFWYRKKP